MPVQSLLLIPCVDVQPTTTLDCPEKLLPPQKIASPTDLGSNPNVAAAVKTNSWWSRGATSPALQLLYASIRSVPVLGAHSHKLMQRIMPAGSRFATRVRKGHGAGLRLCLDPATKPSTQRDPTKPLC